MLRALAFSVLLALVAASARAGAVLELVVATHTEPRSPRDLVPSDKQVELTLTLADKYMVLQTAAESITFDFQNRKRVVVDSAIGTKVEYSLYDTVGFRDMEFHNREGLAKMLAAAKMAPNLMTTLDNENVLAIRDVPSAPLNEAADGRWVSFTSGSSVYTRWSVESTPISAGDSAMFAQFIRYMYGGHPQILAKLAESMAIPAVLELTTSNVGTVTTRLTVKSARKVEAAPLAPFNVPMRNPSAALEPVDQVLDRATAITPEELQTARLRNRDHAALAFREQRAFEAYLDSVEWTLMTGEMLPAFSNEEKMVLQADPTVRKLSSALSAKTKEDFSVAIKVLVDLRSQAGDKAYVLKIFEANDRAQIGELKQAQALFVEVLNANLHVAGVYKDLGDVMMLQYDTPRAWRSWDAGRRLAPKFTNFVPVNQFERTLAIRHPEYF